MEPFIAKIIISIFWGIAGALSWGIALIGLMFMSYKCLKCDKKLSNDEGKKGICPQCGNFKNIEKNNISINQQKINENTNNELVFKSNMAAFEYACKYLDCTLNEGATLPAIVIDAKDELGTEKSVKTQDDGSQLAMIKVASSEGGFIVLANTAGKESTILKPGDFVAWQAMQHMPDIGKIAGDLIFGWAGLIIGTLKPELTSNGWVGDKKL